MSTLVTTSGVAPDKERGTLTALELEWWFLPDTRDQEHETLPGMSTRRERGATRRATVPCLPFARGTLPGAPPSTEPGTSPAQGPEPRAQPVQPSPPVTLPFDCSVDYEHSSL